MKKPPKSATSSISASRPPISRQPEYSCRSNFIRILLSLLFCASFNPVQAQLTHEVAKTWQYVKIYDKQGKTGRKIGAHDLMTLRIDESGNTFSYALQLEDMKAWGKWTIDDSTLVFDYEAVSNLLTKTIHTGVGIRRFRIVTLSNNELLMREVTLPDQPGLFFQFRYFAD